MYVRVATEAYAHKLVLVGAAVYGIYNAAERQLGLRCVNYE